MAVDFCDYFWGEKHDGFQVLMQNLKSSLLAAKELSEFVKEAALIQEHNTKAYAKLSKQLGSNLYFGTFSPMLAALKSSSDKLCQIHGTTLNKINELLKDILKYGEDLHKKHKQIKDEESATSDVVKSLQDTSTLLTKQKEFYKAKQSELEKIRRENGTAKDEEKAESKVKKATDDYRTLVEKYSTMLEEFEKKMGTSCKHFQQAETLYLTHMIDFMQTYVENVETSHNEVGQVNLDLEQQLVNNSVEQMLQSFALQRHTGLVKPGVPGPVELSDLVTVKSAGPPSDISDRSGNSDKLSVSSLPKKESTGIFVEVTEPGDPEDPPSDAEARSEGQDVIPLPSPSSELNRSMPYALSNWSVPGFLKGRKKKEKGKRKSKEEGGDQENKEMGSDGEERRRSQTPTPDQTEEGGYSEPPPNNSLATDPWADFHQPAKKSFYSSSDSDSDDEIKKMKKIKIRPVTATERSTTSASVDELQKAITGIDLTMATLPKRHTPTVDFDIGVKRSQSTILASKPSADLLSLFTNQDTVSDVSGGAPGAESTRLDTSGGGGSNRLDISVTSNNTSKEVSSILHDINIHTEESIDTPSSQALPVTPSAQPLPATPSWPADLPPPATEARWVPPSEETTTLAQDEEEMGPPCEPAPAPPTAATPPWSDSAWNLENSKKEETSWATAWAEPVQPALPPKQNARPASVQREKIASSIISLPRPPSRARPEPRLRGTPSPTPTSFLQTTALSLARSDSIGSTGSDSRLSDRSARSDSLARADFTSKFLDSGKSRSESLGSKPLSLVRSDEVLKHSRSGPLLPPPRSDSPRLLSSRSESPALPPSGPAPTLPAPSPNMNSFATSRGPSPLTLGGAEVVPLAVAFQEVIHAAFRGRDESRCLVKQLGDMMLSFPAGIVSVLASNPYPAPLQFRIKNAGRLEGVLPNKQLISKLKNLSTQDTFVYEFNMSNLQDLLNKQSQINPHASYFNIDILKYQITPFSGAASCPFQMVSYWKCEDDHTDLRLDFKYNQHAMNRAAPLLNLTMAVPVDGGVLNMTSQPKGSWNGDSQRALWKFPDLSQNQNNGVGAIRARFQLSAGPGSQGTIAAQFNCEGTTLSGVEFELLGAGYRVSLVKRRFVSGKYVSEPDYSTDNNRYAAPPAMGSDY